MSAKYTIVPGEVILINKMNAINDRIAEEGVMGLSDIPFIGSMFDNNKASTNNSDILLLLKISFQTNAENAKNAQDAEKKFKEAQETPSTVDMNISDKLVKEVIKEIEKE